MAQQDIRRESFNPRQYLEEYFLEVDEEFDRLYQFWSKALRCVTPGGRALELGVGPSLYSAIPLVTHASEIHLADLVDSNLREIDAWLKRIPGYFDWRGHVKRVLEIEGVQPTTDQIDRREALLRERIRRLRHCDLRSPSPLGSPETFNIVTAHYCTEAAARDEKEWMEIVKRATAIIEPGGALLLSVASGLAISRAYDPSCAALMPPNITTTHVPRAMTSAGMRVHSWAFSPAMEGDPYAGSILCLAIKPLTSIPEDQLARHNDSQLALDGRSWDDVHGHDAAADAAVADQLRDHPLLALEKGRDGWVLVAKLAIDRNTTIINMTGTIVATPSRYTLQLGENAHLGGNSMQFDDYIDHSCDPNCKVAVQNNRVELISIRPIAEREKLTFNYLTTEWDMAEPFDCKCGALNCFKRIAGFRYLSAAQQAAIFPYLTPFLKEKMEKHADLEKEKI